MDEKIVLFPHVKERLLDKGYEALNEKNFEEAYELFKSMETNKIHTMQSELAIVICLVELSRIEEAIDYCEKILKEGFSEEVLDVYLSILLQMEYFEKANEVIIPVLKNEEISDLYHMKLQNLSQIAEKGTDSRNISHTKEQIKEVENILLHDSNVTKQMEIVSILETMNIESILEVLKEFLRDDTKNPVLKSLIIQVLNNKEVDEEIQVCKFGREVMINPKLLDEEAFLFGDEVSKLLSQYIENDNPTMFQALNEQWNYYVFSYYPFVLEPRNKTLWATALYVFGARMYGIPIENREIDDYYRYHEKEIDEIVSRLKNNPDMI